MRNRGLRSAPVASTHVLRPSTCRSIYAAPYIRRGHSMNGGERVRNKPGCRRVVRRGGRRRKIIREVAMKTIVWAAALSLMTTMAHATCKTDAAGKNLAGAALKSFMAKCEKDAKAKCEAD